MIIMTSSFFVKLRFHNVSPLRENEKPAFTNSSGLKSFYEKLCFRVGLASVDGRPNRRNEAVFEIPPLCEPGLKCYCKLTVISEFESFRSFVLK